MTAMGTRKLMAIIKNDASIAMADNTAGILTSNK